MKFLRLLLATFLVLLSTEPATATQVRMGNSRCLYDCNTSKCGISCNICCTRNGSSCYLNSCWRPSPPFEWREEWYFRFIINSFCLALSQLVFFRHTSFLPPSLSLSLHPNQLFVVYLLSEIKLNYQHSLNLKSINHPIEREVAPWLKHPHLARLLLSFHLDWIIPCVYY